MNNILWALLWFSVLGGTLGMLLAIASKAFAVKQDERIPKVLECLPGANCGGCGYAGCAALSEAIVKGDAPTNACPVGGQACTEKISAVMGVAPGKTVRYRAQVMCSGTSEFSKKKYVYEGVADCAAAARLGGGDKLCPNGCIGLGTCVSTCTFDAIKVVNGVATVDYKKCTGCGMCTFACPKHIIELIPYDSHYWVGCKSVDSGAVTRKYCEVGCISCKLCEKNCEYGAITVNDFVASIDQDKCTGCGICVEKCPRHIIWSGQRHTNGELVITRVKLESTAKKEEQAASEEKKDGKALSEG